MSDKLVFDLATESEGVPSVFVRKDWINILDNQNQNYNNNQSIIDTSQLSNSNKYMNYREAYLEVPMLLTVATTEVLPSNNANIGFFPSSGPASYGIGLKNWFGQIIHSFTLDYNGTTIIQQTPFINMWNSFKLMTSLSYQDILTQGSIIGFYPDTADSFMFTPDPAAPLAAVAADMLAPCGPGTTNNLFTFYSSASGSQKGVMSAGIGNEGLYHRCKWINFDPDAVPSTKVGSSYASSLIGDASRDVWKSYISTKIDQAAAVKGVLQISIMATIYLKHVHSFFNMVPLLKGVFMKMTMNLNNTTAEVVTTTVNGVNTTKIKPVQMNLGPSGVSNSVGGVCPFIVCAPPLKPSEGYDVLAPGGVKLPVDVSYDSGSSLFYGKGLYTSDGSGAVGPPDTRGVVKNTYRINLSVGASCLDQTLKSTPNVKEGDLAKSIYLYVPAYTFNPVFEQAYLSSPIKTIRYCDVYQYQVSNIASGQPFNNLITNGIANIKSVLILPFFSSTAGPLVGGQSNTGIGSQIPVYQSPFDPAGTGPTSPMCYLTNFNVQISGQNAIYNMERYNFEQFNNQLYGQNAVNGGLTDGLTSSLIDRQAFDTTYCYYYVNVERMLPVEKSVPKSVQIIGQNKSKRALDFIVFVEYENEIQLDILTGSRV